ncbi:MAG: hypothetical protein ACRDEB_02070 [Chitinophagaceae bacterium]
MNTGLHDMDDNFKSAHRQFEEDPSPEVWENINAWLDKKDSRRRFIFWKRVSLFASLLLTGYILVDSMLMNDSRHIPGITSYKKIESKKQTDPHYSPAINSSMDKKEPTENKTDETIAAGRNKVDNFKSQNKNVWVSSQPVNVFRKTANTNFYTDEEKINLWTKPAYPVKNLVPFSMNITKYPSFNFFSNINPLPLVNHTNQAKPDNHQPLPDPQVNIKKRNNKNFNPFWLFSVYASYDQVGYRLDSDDPIAATTIKHREVHEPSFSGGLLFTKQFSDRWGLQSGIGYTSTQIGISPQKMYALQLPGGDIAYKFITSSGYAYVKIASAQAPLPGDSITTSDAKHLLKHISVPLAVKFKMGGKKLSVAPFGGVEANIITNAKVEVGIDLASNREIVTANKLNGIKKIYWSAATGAEINYQLNKKVSIMLRPVYRQALSPITKNNVVETFPKSFGIGAGVTIRF